jgi:hypothetical protein
LLCLFETYLKMLNDAEIAGVEGWGAVARRSKKPSVHLQVLVFLTLACMSADSTGCDFFPRSAVAAEERTWLRDGSTSPRHLAASSVEMKQTTFTVVVIPDTQYYASKYPEILAAQTRWIVERCGDVGIALVVHEGDIVDKDEPAQWERASRGLHVLDGVVPYVLSVGNHDYHRAADVISRNTMLDKYFPPTGLARSSWLSGTFEPGHLENSFAVIDTPGGAWLVLSLEFGPRDSVLLWADGIAKRFAGIPAIVLTHAYLHSDDTRYDHSTRPDQRWNPHRYLSDATPGSVNDGEEIWRKLVSRNDNILFVLCGHDLGDGTGRLTSVRADGTKVHQVLANYQMDALGGEGYLRLMRFSPVDRRVTIRTYSPYLTRFKTDPDNQFALDY